MQGNAVYIRPKVVGPFPGPCTSGSYMHRAAHSVLLFLFLLFQVLLLKMGVTRVLRKILQKCTSESFLDDKMTFGRPSSSNDLMLKWQIPLFRSIASIFGTSTSNNEKIITEE
jgi:hypothetical protein